MKLGFKVQFAVIVKRVKDGKTDIAPSNPVRTVVCRDDCTGIELALQEAMRDVAKEIANPDSNKFDVKVVPGNLECTGTTFEAGNIERPEMKIVGP